MIRYWLEFEIKDVVMEDKVVFKMVYFFKMKKIVLGKNNV